MNIKEKELELYNQYKSGSNMAKKKLLTSLKPIIQYQVNKFNGSGLPVIALKLEGRRLADHAIDTYDPKKAQLNTHVVNNLKKLSRFVMNYQNIGHIPEPRVLIIGKYNVIYDNLAADLGREPTILELSDAMKISVAEIERLQSELRKDLSITTPTDDGEGGFYFFAPASTGTVDRDEVIKFVYYDADPVDKKIME